MNLRKHWHLNGLASLSVDCFEWANHFSTPVHSTHNWGIFSCLCFYSVSQVFLQSCPLLGWAYSWALIVLVLFVFVFLFCWQLRIELFFWCCCCCSQCVCHCSTGSLLIFCLIILFPAPFLKECMSPRHGWILWLCVEKYAICKQVYSDFLLSYLNPLYSLFWFRIQVQY